MIVVLLRRPVMSRADERRDDPFREFGSFGCTGCHHSNLMNPKRSSELEGARFAFVQGGDWGWRLVHVTPPISVRALGDLCEAQWSPAEMPLAYRAAPLVVDNKGRSDVPGLAALTASVRRPSPVARFASAFRSRRLPLAGVDGAEVLSTYRRFREGGAQLLAQGRGSGSWPTDHPR